MKDFTRAGTREAIEFKIDDDVFRAVPSIGGELLRPMIMGSMDGVDMKVIELARDGKSDQISSEDMMRVVKSMQAQTDRSMQFLDLVLEPESAQLFARRLTSVTNPITLEQAQEIYQWLLSEYGRRPTKPSNSSSPASPVDAGMSSTDGAQLTVSRPLSSILTDSSTSSTTP